ncbi:MAG: Fic family protein [Candidatus Riflebacteria bacterium]|nr:Fic family protein [Candidatus Riflebacteria bacterium]
MICKARKDVIVVGKPPYTITEKSADYLAKIIEIVTRLELGTDFKKNIRLHRENRVRTIHSSLAIEGNELSLDEVTAVIDGKKIVGRQADIREVKNAYRAYDKIMFFDPYSVNDFLRAHKLMTEGLLAEAGKFRSKNVGVFDDSILIHLGARPQYVPQLVAELFAWAKSSELHPVLKSAILHYEIETIHPFADGNGRIGRLWQTLVLAKWNSVFAWLPMEAVIYRDRADYYSAIEASRDSNDSGVFIEFTLSALLQTIINQMKHQDEHQDEHQDKRFVELSDIQIAVLKALIEKPLSRKDIFERIKMSYDSRAYKRIAEPLLNGGLIEMTLPEKPTSRHQQYRLTDIGRNAIRNK